MQTFSKKFNIWMNALSRGARRGSSMTYSPRCGMAKTLLVQTKRCCEGGADWVSGVPPEPLPESGSN
eukprot:4591233-Pyramimonas_sp.AAC.1